MLYFHFHYFNGILLFLFFKRFFWYGPFLNWICYNIASFFLFSWPQSMWYLSSLTRDWTRTPCNEKLQLLLFWCILWSMGYMMMMCVLSRVWLFATPWTVACQAPLSMGFSRQEYMSRLPSPSPGDLPDPGVKPGSLALQADSLLSKPPGKPKMTKSRCGLVMLSQGTFSLKPSLALLAFLLACLLLSH